MKIPGLDIDLDHLRPYFIGDEAGPERYRYVLSLDIMGARGKMLRNVRTASIPIMKLQIAALASKGKNTKGPVDLFPMVDGLYAVTESLDPMMFFISDVFRSMAAEFLSLKPWEQSVIRGALAYGPVILGRESKGSSEILAKTNYADSILLGMPLVQAFTAEAGAPPFGVYVHESARSFAPPEGHPVAHVFWRWWLAGETSKKLASKLAQELKGYFAHCRKFPMGTFYAPDRIAAHQELAREYFDEFETASG